MSAVPQNTIMDLNMNAGNILQILSIPHNIVMDLNYVMMLTNEQRMIYVL